MTSTLIAVLLSGILGMVGQGARAVIGLKQLADDAANPNVSQPETFSAARLVVSLIIGFIAGVLSAMALGFLDPGQTAVAFDNKTMLGLVAAGYAGTDVIEGFMSKYAPRTGSSRSSDPSPASFSGTNPAPTAGSASLENRAIQAFRMTPELQASLVGLQALASAPRLQDQSVRAACEAEWEANKSDCSAFVRAVAARLGASVSGNADAITSSLGAGSPWAKLPDGPAAAEAARQGLFVVAGLRGADQAAPSPDGHVVLVVDGALNRGMYPRAYWGKLNGIGSQNQTINWAWKEIDRDKVVYASYEP